MAWRSGSRRAAALCLAGAALAAAPAAAAPELDATVAYLQRVQNADGGFSGQPGGESDPTFSAWAAYALAAASINSQDQSQPGGADVFSYLARHTVGLSATTDFDRVLLVALAAGTPPHDFGGVDPVARILERQLADGSFPQEAGASTGAINATIWSILPLSALPEPAAVSRAADWLAAQQNADGGYSWSAREADSNVDTTGAAIQAFRAAGRGGGEEERRALDFLRQLQNPDGGFPETAAQESNTASTAWVVQGLWAAGIDPRGWRTPAGADPLAYLASMQRPDGSIRWKRSADVNPIWMTAMAAPAFAGRWHPIPPVARAVRPPAPPPPGVGGVGAGGGGEGAPLFSRPQPQSRGRHPGGVRRTRPNRRRPGPATDKRERGSDGPSPDRPSTTAERAGGDRSRSRPGTTSQSAGGRQRRSGAGTTNAGRRRSPAGTIDVGRPRSSGDAADDRRPRSNSTHDAEDRATGRAGAEAVSGRLVGGPGGPVRAQPAGLAAPGLRTAGVVRDTSAALTLAGLLLGAAGLGAAAERRTRGTKHDDRSAP